MQVSLSELAFTLRIETYKIRIKQKQALLVFSCLPSTQRGKRRRFLAQERGGRERCRHHPGDLQSLRSTGYATPDQGWDSSFFSVITGVIAMTQTGGYVLLLQIDLERAHAVFFRWLQSWLISGVASHS